MPQNPIDRYAKGNNITLTFTFCINDEPINTQTIKVNSDTKILCEADNMIQCHKAKG